MKCGIGFAARLLYQVPSPSLTQEEMSAEDLLYMEKAPHDNTAHKNGLYVSDSKTKNEGRSTLTRWMGHSIPS